VGVLEEKQAHFLQATALDSETSMDAFSLLTNKLRDRPLWVVREPLSVGGVGVSPEHLCATHNVSQGQLKRHPKVSSAFVDGNGMHVVPLTTCK
jgi:hypothetical protein